MALIEPTGTPVQQAVQQLSMKVPPVRPALPTGAETGMTGTTTFVTYPGGPTVSSPLPPLVPKWPSPRDPSGTLPDYDRPIPPFPQPGLEWSSPRDPSGTYPDYNRPIPPFPQPGPVGDDSDYSAFRSAGGNMYNDPYWGLILGNPTAPPPVTTPRQPSVMPPTKTGLSLTQVPQGQNRTFAANNRQRLQAMMQAMNSGAFSAEMTIAELLRAFPGATVIDGMRGLVRIPGVGVVEVVD